MKQGLLQIQQETQAILASGSAARKAARGSARQAESAPLDEDAGLGALFGGGDE